MCVVAGVVVWVGWAGVVRQRKGVVQQAGSVQHGSRQAVCGGMATGQNTGSVVGSGRPSSIDWFQIRRVNGGVVVQGGGVSPSRLL